MPWNPTIPPEVRTVHLGEFAPGNAERIAEALEAAGIWWWSKEPGGISSVWQLGVELFVDRERLEEANALVASVVDVAR